MITNKDVMERLAKVMDKVRKLVMKANGFQKEQIKGWCSH